MDNRIINETNYKLQIEYNQWINTQNKNQRGCSHITKQIFIDNIDFYRNTEEWWFDDPGKIRSNLLWKGHLEK
jgi:hypothetical protein